MAGVDVPTFRIVIAQVVESDDAGPTTDAHALVRTSATEFFQPFGSSLTIWWTCSEEVVMAVQHVPEGYSTATPYLIIKGASEAIDFYKQAFGATEVMRFGGPDGKVGHAEIQIGNSRVMLADEHPERGYRSPQSLGGSGTGILLYLEDVDQVFSRALQAGAKPLDPVKDQFYGDRTGTLVDPFGHWWTVATHIEDVSQEEMQRRAEVLSAQT
jgi:PhnB protein